VSTDAASVVETAPPTDVDASPEGTSVRGGARHAAGGAGRLTGRRVARIAAALVALQLLVRACVALSGYFSQDDLILASRAASTPITLDFLLGGHDGHFMPAGLLLSSGLTRLAPLEWGPVVATSLVLQAVASLAVWRLLRVLLGSRPAVLLPLLLYLFSPLTLPTFSVWTSALATLPLQAGLAWVCADAVGLHRTGRLRYAVSGTLVFAGTLAFTEKALVIPVVAVAVVALLGRQSGDRAPLLAGLWRGLWLWGGLVLVGALWFWRFSSVVGPPLVAAERSGSVATAVDAVGLGVFHAVLPGLFGGPLFWTDTGPWASPPMALVVTAGVATAIVVLWTSWRYRGTGVIWWLVAAYVVASVVVTVLGRLNAATPAELTLSLRHVADVAVVVAIGVALIARAPARDDGRAEVLNTTERRDVVVLGAAVFLAISLWSTVTFAQAWHAGSTREYLTNAQQALTETAEAPLLDRAVPSDVVWAPAFPYNLVSRVFAPIGVEVARSTPELEVLDDSGRLVDGRVTNGRAVFAGPIPGCGHLVDGVTPTDVALNGPTVTFGWTVQLNYLANRDGWMEVSFEGGDPVRVAVREGTHSVYLSLQGGGDSLLMSSQTPDLSVCIDTGLVGSLEAAG
jgi:hypothetical protein